MLNIAIPTPDTILSTKLKPRNNPAVDIIDTNLVCACVQVFMCVSVSSSLDKGHEKCYENAIPEHMKH